MAQKPRVGFIGLGIMGQPMAGHVLRSGFDLQVFNRTAAKCNDLVAAGARAAATPAALAAQCDIIICMVSDSPDVLEVVTGAAGVAHGVRPGSVVVDMSTVTPDTERQAARAVEQAGGLYVDAPVSGGDVGAKAGTLSIMAGGTEAALERVRPVLACMGKTITHCGPVGAGQVAKLCNQILVGGTLAAVCEALVFAQQQGLAAPTLIEAVSQGAAGSWQLSNLGPRMAQRDFAPGFMIDLMQKDLRAVLQSAAAAQTPLPLSSLVAQLFTSAQKQGDGAKGTQALLTVFEKLAGV